MFALTETSFYIISARRVISQAHRLLIDNWVCLPLPLSALLCTLFLLFHNHYLEVQKWNNPSYQTGILIYEFAHPKGPKRAKIPFLMIYGKTVWALRGPKRAKIPSQRFSEKNGWVPRDPKRAEIPALAIFGKKTFEHPGTPRGPKYPP